MKHKYFPGICCAIAVSAAISGCTTYTWPDGSRETVLGVPAEEENARYEEPLNEPVRYRIPGEKPDKEKRE